MISTAGSPSRRSTPRRRRERRQEPRPDAQGPGHEDPAPGSTTDLDNRFAEDGSGVQVGRRKVSHDPGRFGHEASTCSTCQVVVAMASRRNKAELRALQAGARRIVDLGAA
jgi:hypothetical protein